MDIRKLSLQLSGKTPPEYKKYNRLEFMGMLEDIFGLSLEKIDFYWKQAKEYEEEFYFLVLELLHNKSLKDGAMKTKFEKLMNDLALNKESEKLVLGDYENEEDFTQNFLLDFFKKLGYRDVRYNHGTDEKGKDIIMKKIDELGEYRYIGVQAKKGDIDAKSNKTGITNILTQAIKSFNNDYDDLEINKKVRMSEYFIVTNGKITEKAVDEIMNIEPTYFKNNIHFIDQTKIKNLLDTFN